MEGEYLAGLDWRFNGGGQLCDACIRITTGTGKSLVARVVTNGQTKDQNDVDLSPAAFAALHSNEYPRSMSWQVITCPDSGKIQYQYQTEANEWWTSLWVRNIRAPLAKVEVLSRKHTSWFSLRRETDGTYNADRGFGSGAFTLRMTSTDGQVVSETFPGFQPGSLVPSAHQFQ
jgi:expansin (peptidoglycan-binding protein)